MQIEKYYKATVLSSGNYTTINLLSSSEDPDKLVIKRSQNVTKPKPPIYQ